MQKFVERIIAWALHNHLVVLFLTGLMAAIGVTCYLNTPIEAYPDVTNSHAIVITQWAGRGAEEVEKFVTVPVMQQLNAIPRKSVVRSVSLFGLSWVVVHFEDGIDDFYAQVYTANRLKDVELPEGAEIAIEPPSTATGLILRYYLESDLPISEVAAVNEWVVERELMSVPGISMISPFGGEEKIYEVQLNPVELKNYDLTPLQVFQAIAEGNINVGGDIIEKGEQAFVVRGIGLLTSVEDIEDVLVETKGNTPVRVRQVAMVSVAAKPRLGQCGFNENDDVVQGQVWLLHGEDPSAVIRSVKAKIEELNGRLEAEGVKIVVFQDRMKLVNLTKQTVMTNMLIGICLVALVVFIFLANLRGAFIVASVMPLSFLFAIIMLRVKGLSANLISMGAVDFGLMLQGPLVLVEIVFVNALAKSKLLGEKYRLMSKGGLIKRSTAPVAYGIFSGLVILMLALMPIFSFQKVEGKMFAPFAYTLGFALLGSLLLSLTYVPVMCKILLNKPIREHKNPLNHFLPWLMFSLYKLAARFRVLTLLLFALLLAGCVVRFLSWGTEFIPHMNEGSIFIHATLQRSVNLKTSVRVANELRRKLMAFEEAEFVVTMTGQPNDGTDPVGFFNIEILVDLKPEKQWTRKITKIALVKEMQEMLSAYPGMSLCFTQPIEHEIEEEVSGVHGQTALKIYGRDLRQLEALADQAAEVLNGIHGLDDVTVVRSLGASELQIKLDEHRMARYGIAKVDAQSVIEMAIGGKTATTFYEDDRTFDIVVRFAREFRNDEKKIGDILIPTMEGLQIPLREIAEFHFLAGPAFIYREGGSRYVAVAFSVRDDRDLGSAMEEAQRKVGALLALKPENKIMWAGEFESQQRAMKRLTVIVPVALLLSLFVLYITFGTIRDSLIVASAMPYAFIGGLISIMISGMTFGISVGVGFIIMFGIVSIDNIVLVTGIKRMLRQSRDLKHAIDVGVRQRLRPVLMTSLISSVGLLPAALSTGIGSEVQRPLATVIVGGQVFCMLLSFAVLPQVFYFAYRRHPHATKG
ncbi:MAG: CusA/CzcA family heavy metal efflux RND transporter [Kiritimatiellaeota bacterium]|nr:CusA/CzcA family heavy metal efflux RND transporter [Kiritimatiellota bacterium]